MGLCRHRVGWVEGAGLCRHRVDWADGADEARGGSQCVVLAGRGAGQAWRGAGLACHRKSCTIEAGVKQEHEQSIKSMGQSLLIKEHGAVPAHQEHGAVPACHYLETKDDFLERFTITMATTAMATTAASRRAPRAAPATTPTMIPR